MKDFILAFIPLFIAIDVMGVMPIFLGLTVGMSAEQKRRVVRAACITALCVATGFIFLGNSLFHVLGVTAADFRIAGGLLLVIFAIQDLVVGGKQRRTSSPTVAVVPLGMPLIVGPGVLTASLLLMQQVGVGVTLAAFCVNLVIVFVVLRLADRILAIITPAGAVAVAKIASLFLATIGVMMLRLGIEETVRAFGKS